MSTWSHDSEPPKKWLLENFWCLVFHLNELLFFQSFGSHLANQNWPSLQHGQLWFKVGNGRDGKKFYVTLIWKLWAVYNKDRRAIQVTVGFTGLFFNYAFCEFLDLLLWLTTWSWGPSFRHREKSSNGISRDFLWAWAAYFIWALGNVLPKMRLSSMSRHICDQNSKGDSSNQ